MYYWWIFLFYYGLKRLSPHGDHHHHVVHVFWRAGVENNNGELGQRQWCGHRWGLFFLLSAGRVTWSEHQKEPLHGSDHKYTLMEEEEDTDEKTTRCPILPVGPDVRTPPSEVKNDLWPDLFYSPTHCLIFINQYGSSVWFQTQPQIQSFSLLSLTLHLKLYINTFPLTYFEEGDVQVTVEMMKIVISGGATMSESASA